MLARHSCLALPPWLNLNLAKIKEAYKTYFWQVVRYQYMQFSGRANRKQFWGYLLFITPFYIAIIAINTALIHIFRHHFFLNNIFYWLFALPTLAIIIRRLHDINHKALWWLLFPIFPRIGLDILPYLVMPPLALLKGGLWQGALLIIIQTLWFVILLAVLSKKSDTAENCFGSVPNNFLSPVSHFYPAALWWLLLPYIFHFLGHLIFDYNITYTHFFSLIGTILLLWRTAIICQKADSGDNHYTANPFANSIR